MNGYRERERERERKGHIPVVGGIVVGFPHANCSSPLSLQSEPAREK